MSNERVARVETPQKTFFFKRPDGTYFETHENEAWNLYRLKKFEYVGVSRGVIFSQAVPQAQKLFDFDKEQARSILLEARKKEYEEACQNKTPPTNKDTVNLGRV